MTAQTVRRCSKWGCLAYAGSSGAGDPPFCRLSKEPLLLPNGHHWQSTWEKRFPDLLPAACHHQQGLSICVKQETAVDYARTNHKTPTIQLRSVLFSECFMFPGKDRLYLVIRPPSGYAAAVRKSLVVDLASGNAEFVDDNMQVIPVDTFTTISPHGRGATPAETP